MLEATCRQFAKLSPRFYGAEVCLALKFLHENGILHRGTKLNNILLAPDGHVKIIDFVSSKDGMGPGDTTSSFVGCAEFMAPEVSTEQTEIVAASADT